MLQIFNEYLPYFNELTGENTGPAYQVVWWAAGFMLGATISVLSWVVRAIKMAGSTSPEL